jgi:PAS domain S-box-containing protein
MTDPTGVPAVEALLASIVRSSNDAIVGMTPDGVITTWNAGAERLYGYAADEVRGRHVGLLTAAPQCRDDEIAVLRRVAAGERVEQCEASRVRKDGTVVPVSLTVSPIVNDAGALVGLAIMARELGPVDAESSHTDQVLARGFRGIGRSDSPRDLIRLLIVDDHAMISEAFQLLLSNRVGVEVVGSVPTSKGALAAASRLRPDVVLIDFDLPDVDGVATATAIKAAHPEVSLILMIQSQNEEVVSAAIAAGCAGVLHKDRAWVELVAAVRAAYHGETSLSEMDLQGVLPRDGAQGRDRTADLTAREREVLACISEGLSNRAVGERLHVTTNTVRNHVQRILYKLDVHSKLEAVVVATQTDR